MIFRPRNLIITKVGGTYSVPLKIHAAGINMDFEALQYPIIKSDEGTPTKVIQAGSEIRIKFALMYHDKLYLGLVFGDPVMIDYLFNAGIEPGQVNVDFDGSPIELPKYDLQFDTKAVGGIGSVAISTKQFELTNLILSPAADLKLESDEGSYIGIEANGTDDTVLTIT
jgi:hypothetical protein